MFWAWYLPRRAWDSLHLASSVLLSSRFFLWSCRFLGSGFSVQDVRSKVYGLGISIHEVGFYDKVPETRKLFSLFGTVFAVFGSMWKHLEADCFC